MLTPVKIFTHSKPDIVELVFPSSPPFYSTSQKTKIIDIIQMPSPNFGRKYDSIITALPKKNIIKTKAK